MKSVQKLQTWDKLWSLFDLLPLKIEQHGLYVSDVLELIHSKYPSFCLCLTVSCVEEILKADPGQLQAEDSLYGGTPLHWAKTAEVKNVSFCVVRYP